MLKTIQTALYDRAIAFRSEHTSETDSYDEFKQILNGQGGFIRVHWAGTGDDEDRIKEETKATIRLLPFERQEGKDLVSGKPGVTAIFARAY